MRIKFEVKKIKDIKADAVSSFVFEDIVDTKLHWLNTLFKGNLDVLIDSKDFKGKENEIALSYVNSDARTRRLIVTGLGKSKEITLEKIRNAYAVATKKMSSLKLTNVGFEIPDLTLIKGFTNESIPDIIQAITEGVLLSQYSFNKFISENKTEPIDEITFFTDSPKFVKEITDSFKNAKIICDAVYLARDLGNEPSNYLTPQKFSEIIKKVSSKAAYSVTVFDDKKIKQLNMGGIIGVSQGSSNPPIFLILQYFGSSKSEKPVVLVGKGVTFDSGGISLKPALGMEDMKMDMCGAAAVVGAFEAVSRLHVKINLIGLIPLVENMPSGTALKPGDIITSYSGITIEVENTDAEGRLILADALGYAANYKPKAVIDAATLTGAAVITFGHLVAGIMGTDETLIKKIFEAGQKTYERVWELPLYTEYDKLMKSEISDIKNTGAPRQAGTIMGGIFLKKFVDNKYPWAHIDIAGTAMINTEQSEYVTKEATGFGVRLFVEFLKNYNSN
jgi:leucyl aminopeptidase